ncbi:MAG: hypothetical protein Q9208_006275 [Pyrenodesmia sp. 3 TL-2023]
MKSSYTLTYVPSTITAATTLVQGTSTTSVDAGAVVALLAGGAAAAALPLAIPKGYLNRFLKPPSQKLGEMTTRIEGVRRKLPKPVASNVLPIETAGCSPTDNTQTITQPIATPSVTIVTRTSSRALAIPPPLDYLALQVYLGDEYLRLHIDDNTNRAECEMDAAKGVLEANIADFCKSNNGIGASPNSGLLTTYNQDENRMQVVLQVLYTGGRGHGAIYTVDEEKCNNLFAKILPCGPDQDHTNGGNITFEKGVFVLEPHTYSGKLECAPEGGKYGVVKDEALANIDDFCGKSDGQTINQGESKDEKYLQKVGGLASTISVAWEPTSIGCDEGGLFDHGYLINKAACKRFLGQTINDCNKDQVNFKAAGTTTDQCAKYQLFVESRERVLCGSDPGYSEDVRATYLAFDPSIAHEAI